MSGSVREKADARMGSVAGRRRRREHVRELRIGDRLRRVPRLTEVIGVMQGRHLRLEDAVHLGDDDVDLVLRERVPHPLLGAGLLGDRVGPGTCVGELEVTEVRIPVRAAHRDGVGPVRRRIRRSRLRREDGAERP
ncbi:hypothetical protein GCM10009755_19440 [Brevibacterium samyangense]|uniref:Uncharacterized protein n=1 Tax=Brevibacterium samyangense TaxID=366888 RepID=A0ABN2TH00_9MICO